MGGTWDLFRYPGVRSDSDMHTLGYRFKPWRAAKAIADGPSILDYVRETAAEYDVDRHIRYQHLATKAVWSSEAATWTVDALQNDSGKTVRFTCNFLFMCAATTATDTATRRSSKASRTSGQARPSAAVAGRPRLPARR